MEETVKKQLYPEDNTFQIFKVDFWTESQKFQMKARRSRDDYICCLQVSLTVSVAALKR